eukprot:5605003-Pleurochrysis_carterae.AAC.1
MPTLAVRTRSYLVGLGITSGNLPKPYEQTKILLPTSNYRASCRSFTDTLRTCASTLRGLY